MKYAILLVALACAICFAPTSVHAQAKISTHQTHPQIACQPIFYFQQAANFYHETMYASLYSQATGNPCVADGAYFVKGQVDFSGSQSHTGTIYAELMAGPPYLPIEYGTVNYSPSTNVATSASSSSVSACGLKAFVLFDQNGLGFLSTQLLSLC